MYKLIKRGLDILLCLIAFPFFLLACLFVAPAIWLTDHGPVFYTATRAGKGGRPFRMIKFRSMRVNAPDIRNADGSTFNGANDPRVTKIGRVLRKTSLDEIPQILNVLGGSMSLVGPRPTLYSHEIHLEELDENRRKHYAVRPGITGYSQAYFRNSITQEEKFANDAYYADHISFGLDVRILFETVRSVLAHKNIHIAADYNTRAAEERQPEEVHAGGND